MRVSGVICAILIGAALIYAPAQATPTSWVAWDQTLGERHGPKQAAGLLIYLHGRGTAEAFKEPLPPIFASIARQSRWDVLRLNRPIEADLNTDDQRILKRLEERVAEARLEGYEKVFVAGVSRGGWLALSAVGLPGIDGIVGIVPGTTGLVPHALMRQRDVLAEKLRGARVPRVAIFLFEGDPREEVPDGRGPAFRAALQAAGTSYMVVDRPPGAIGHSAVASGRFARRYRDCLSDFITSGTPVSRGQTDCSGSFGYAVGADIGFPTLDPAIRVPLFADKAYAPYVGRWEGEDETGAYTIMQATEIGHQHISILIGHSPSPYAQAARPWLREFRFVLDQSGGIELRYPNGSTRLSASLIDAEHLEFQATSSTTQSVWKYVMKKVKSP